jgi:lysyl-tRNA synthetase class 2
VYESQFEERLYNERREKLRQIAALGQKAGLSYAAATYPNHYAVTHTVPELRAAYDPMTAEQFEAELAAGKKVEVSIAGRIMAIRVQGKAGFAQLQQAGSSMCARTMLAKTCSRCTSCWTWATTSARAASCSAPARAS